MKIRYEKPELAKLRALRAFIPYVPWFLCALITRLARLTCYLHALFTRDIKSLIYYILYIHIHIKVNYVINIIYEKTFRSDLSTQKKPLV